MIEVLKLYSNRKSFQYQKESSVTLNFNIDLFFKISIHFNKEKKIVTLQRKNKINYLPLISDLKLSFQFFLD